MPGFVFPSRKVELLGVEIIFLRNVQPVLNFSKDETFLKENWSNRQRKKYTVNTIPFQIYSIFFFALYKLTWDVASSFPFSLEGARKRFLFYNRSFFVISPIKSIPFLKFLRDHLRSTLGITCGRGPLAVHFGDHLRYCTALKITTQISFVIACTFSVNLSRNSCIFIRVSLKAGGRGFPPSTMSVAPGYFYWKIKEK